MESDRLVDKDDGLVLLHQIGPGEIGGLQRLADAQLLAGLHADRAIAGGEVVADLGLGAAFDHHVGRFDHFIALDAARQDGGFDGLDRGAGETQFCRGGHGFIGNFESDVVTIAAGVEPRRDRLHVAGVGGFQPQVLHVAVEGQSEVGGVAEAVPVLQRAGDRSLDVLAFERAGQPRDRNLPEIAGVDADHLMRAQRGQNPVHRHRAGGSEIRRAVDRDLRRRAGIVDDVADPHQIAGHRDVGAQHRCCDHVVAGLRRGGRRRGHEQGEGEGERAKHRHHHLPQRNMLAVDCIIWSAALTTLAFIS